MFLFLCLFLWTKFPYGPNYNALSKIWYQLFPEVGWTSLYPLILITSSSVKLCIIKCQTQMSNTGRVQFTIHIKTNFNWSVYFDQNLLDYATCKVLQVIPCPLQGVFDVLSLINTLDKAQICQGHTNAKYAGLVAHRNVNVRY